MYLFFLLCAVFGGTVLVGQVVLSYLGFGGGEHDLGDDGGLIDTDGDGHSDVGADNTHHDSTWLFGLITFRTVVAALTFFGLAGLAAQSADLEQPFPLLVATAAGAAAMYGVYLLMRGLAKLNYEGTERISRAVGQGGVVYLAIPAGNAGAGKIHMTLQNRLVEYEATTAGERLPSGTRVVVVDVLGPDRVRVEPAPQTVSTAHV